MGLVDKIKQDVKKSGQNKGKFIYFRASMFLVRSFSERIVLIVMMTVFVLVLSISGLYGIMRPRKFSCSCSL